MITLGADFGSGQVFLAMLEFFLFVIWIWLLIVVFGDLFRSHDLSGWAKAAWVILIVILPYIGVLVYLIARGHTMAERSLQAARARDTATRAYIQQTVSGASAGSGTISEDIAKLTSLKEQGLITDAEFERLKAKTFAR